MQVSRLKSLSKEVSVLNFLAVFFDSRRRFRVLHEVKRLRDCKLRKAMHAGQSTRLRLKYIAVFHFMNH